MFCCKSKTGAVAAVVIDNGAVEAPRAWLLLVTIVPPGTNLNPADAGYTPPAIADPALRRR